MSLANDRKNSEDRAWPKRWRSWVVWTWFSSILCMWQFYGFWSFFLIESKYLHVHACAEKRRGRLTSVHKHFTCEGALAELLNRLSHNVQGRLSPGGHESQRVHCAKANGNTGGVSVVGRSRLLLSLHEGSRKECSNLFVCERERVCEYLCCLCRRHARDRVLAQW